MRGSHDGHKDQPGRRVTFTIRMRASLYADALPQGQRVAFRSNQFRQLRVFFRASLVVILLYAFVV